MTEPAPELPQAPISLEVLHDEVEVAREIQFSILPPTMRQAILEYSDLEEADLEVRERMEGWWMLREEEDCGMR